MNNNKIIVILGQTSTGKSDFAVEIAKQIKGEVISADSRQVYKGMNLGTGKITKKEMQGVKHHLLDITSPSKVFSVNNFQKLANKEIKNIQNKNKIPIICGGTGFYIDSIINETIFPKVPPNKRLRMELSNKTPEQLFEMLKKLDADRAKNIDAKNSIRLIRAIEIAKALGKVPSLKLNQNQSGTNSAIAEFVPLGRNSNFEFLKIGLTIEGDILKEMIKERMLLRIKKGMIKEIKDLHEKEKISWKRLESFGLEYRNVSLYLQNKMKKEEMIERLNTDIWHFAKRQKTWFKRDKNIIWINPTKKQEKSLAVKKIKVFLEK